MDIPLFLNSFDIFAESISFVELVKVMRINVSFKRLLSIKRPRLDSSN